jgi:hypothetical protein
MTTTPPEGPDSFFADQPDADVVALPGSFDFDLDSWQPDAKDVIEPFRAKVNGRVIVFNDPRDQDWRDLLNLSNPVQFIRVTTSDDDRRYLLDQALPSRKLDAMMKGFMDHFKIEDAIAEAQRADKLRGL